MEIRAGIEQEEELAARGKSPAAFDRPCIPPELRCSLGAYVQYAPASRLARRAPDRSRRDTGFHHGLLAFRLSQQPVEVLNHQ